MRLPQRQTLARCVDGAALDRGRDAEATKGFRRLKAHKQLTVLRAALVAHQAKHKTQPALEPTAAAG